MNRVCCGCGATLQCVNPNENGYIIKEKMCDADYCERCFKIIHYGKTMVVDTPKDIDSIINVVNNDIKHSLFLVDLLNINKFVIDIYHKVNDPKTLVICKSDMFNGTVREILIKNLLRKYYKINDNIIFISTIQDNTNKILDYLLNSKINESYILGFINSGKSSLINKILSKENQCIKGLTTSYIPHTTMDFIEMKINDELTLIDSPGFSYDNFLTNDIKLLKKINSKSKLKPITYQMKQNDTLLIENFITITTDNKNSFTLYINSNLSHKKIYNKFDLSKKTVFSIDNNCDLIIKGIGFINIKKACNIEVMTNDDNLCEIRPSLFGGINE